MHSNCNYFEQMLKMNYTVSIFHEYSINNAFLVSSDAIIIFIYPSYKKVLEFLYIPCLYQKMNKIVKYAKNFRISILVFQYLILLEFVSLK